MSLYRGQSLNRYNKPLRRSRPKRRRYSSSSRTYRKSRGLGSSFLVSALVILGVCTLALGFVGTAPYPKPILSSVEVEERFDFEPQLSSGPSILEEQRSGLSFTALGVPKFSEKLAFERSSGSELFTLDPSGRKIFSTLSPELQTEAKAVLEKFSVPWGAVVALEPKTGRVLAFAEHTEGPKAGEFNLLSNAHFPAASLFKLVTAAAAIETSGIKGATDIAYRGGNYSLGRHNYKPNPRTDRRRMTLADAVAKSCNPVFGRIVLGSLSKGSLEDYANHFGFNSNIPFEMPLERSTFVVANDDLELARAGAGFGDSRISVLHAAALAGMIANKGKMMRPILVDRIVGNDDSELYAAKPLVLKDGILDSTSSSLLEMMTLTVKDGTARRQFARSLKGSLRNVDIAAKTGTLSGEEPNGRYYWFVAAAPADNPEIALATLVIDPGGARINGSGLGRRILEHYFSELS